MVLSKDCKNNLEQLSCKNIIFEETKYQLESAVSFSQYIFRCSRIITAIGELHNKTFKCNSPDKLTISISDYSAKAVKNNPRCRVILEYYKNDGKGNTKSDVPGRMNSHAIKQTFKAIQQLGKENQIIPLDFRPTFLTRKGQDDLYGNEWWEQTLTHNKVRKAFIDPFVNSIDKFIIKHPQNYSTQVTYFLRSYFDNMVNEFRIIDMLIKEKESILYIRLKLLDAWKLVADYFIIKKVLNEDENVDEYILILGEAHLINIQRVFNKLSSLITPIVKVQKGKKGKCVRLFQTYRF